MSFQVVDFAQHSAELERIGAEIERKLTEAMAGGTIGKGKRERTILAPMDKIVMAFDSGHSPKAQAVLGMHRTNGYNVDGENCDLIMVNPYTLGRSALSIAETVIHEMVHHIAKASDISDTSRGGYYHTHAFRELCDASGLLGWVEDKKYGCNSVLSAQGESWIDEILQPNFGNMFKNMETHPEAKKNTAVKFECPDCGTKATVTSAKSVEAGFTPMCALYGAPHYMQQVAAE